MIFVFAPRPQFLSRSIRKESSINVLTFKTSPERGYGRCEQIFTLFFRPHVKSTLGQCTVAPQGDPDALSLHDTSHMHPPPAPRPRDAARRPPEGRYTSIHTMPITPEKRQPNSMRLVDAAGGHRAREHARWRRLQLRLRPGRRHGRCRCACRRVGATVRCCRAYTGPDRGQKRQAERENEAEMR